MSHLITQSDGISYIQIDRLPTVDEVILINNKLNEMENIERPIAYHAKEINFSRSRVAIVASQDLAFGLGRMFQLSNQAQAYDYCQ